MSADTSTYQPAAIPDEGTATQVYRIVIKATPQEIWDAITLPEFTRRYFHGAAITITPDGYASFGPDGSSWGDAEVLEWDPPNRVVHGWKSLYDPTLSAEAESRVTWEITPDDENARSVAHGRSSTSRYGPTGVSTPVVRLIWARRQSL